MDGAGTAATLRATWLWRTELEPRQVTDFTMAHGVGEVFSPFHGSVPLPLSWTSSKL